MEWVERGGDWFLFLDEGAPGGGTYVAARRAPEPGAWRAVARVDAAQEEREIGDGFPGLEIAQDMALKLGIQALARAHGVSPAPGRPAPDASEAEQRIADLWEALARLHG